MTSLSSSSNHDYNTVRPSDEDWAAFSNGSLVLLLAKPDKSGRYLCHVTNGIGQELNQVVNFTVKAPPYILGGGGPDGIISTSPSRNMFVSTSVGVESTKLECEAKGDRPITVTWTKV